MKLTTEQIRQLIKEELAEMVHTEQRYDQVEMDRVPPRGIPQIKKFANLQKELEQYFGDHQPAAAAERFDPYQADKMEDLIYRLEREMDNQGGQDPTGAISNFTKFIRQVVEELRNS